MGMPRPVVARDGGLREGAGAVTTFRMATWNLRHGRGPDRVDLGAAAGLIAALDCDLVAVQEVDRGQTRSGRADQIADLALRLGWHGQFAPSLVGGRCDAGAAAYESVDDGGPAYGIGLLSRHPLRDPVRIVLPPEPVGGHVADGEPRVLLRASVATAIGDVDVAATHLSWAPWQAWRQLRWVLGKACSADRPTVLAGDLNLPACVLSAALAGSGWRAASAGPTFPAHLPLVQLDHVLVRNARFTDVRVARAGPSDHRLLSAALVGSAQSS
jgi:endonuclease/exonuclease/phosphatase family metal-dependent hydrolase